jgi:ubiquinone/menaquinone biosynthesis C-methylase UbiE
MSRRQGKSAVQRYHDRVARRYDASYDDAFWRWHDALTWDYLKPYLPRTPGAAVLDLGCGTGKWTLRLLKSGYAVTAVDIAGRMLEQARKNVEAAGLSARASFLQADLADLSDLPREAFVLAVALGEPIGCCESPPRAIKEIRKRLASDGIVVATLDNQLAAIDHYLDRGRVDELAEFLRTGRTHWLTDDADERFPLQTHTPAQAEKLFTRAGFEVVDLIGKTVLPMRYYRRLLEDAANRRALATLEKRLCRDPAAVLYWHARRRDAGPPANPDGEEHARVCRSSRGAFGCGADRVRVGRQRAQLAECGLRSGCRRPDRGRGYRKRRDEWRRRTRRRRGGKHQWPAVSVRRRFGFAVR